MPDWVWKLIQNLSNWDTQVISVENQFQPKYTAAGEKELDGTVWVYYSLIESLGLLVADESGSDKMTSKIILSEGLYLM